MTSNSLRQTAASQLVSALPRVPSRVGLSLASTLVLLACGEAEELTSSLSQALTQQRVEAESPSRFFDSDTAHSGNCGSGPVDAETTSDPKGGGCHVGWTTPGEWLEYDVTLLESGNYDFVLRLASAQAGRTVHLEVDGVNVSGVVTAPNSGWQAFADRRVSNIALNAGQHRLRVVFETGSVNLNYTEVIQTSVAQTVVVTEDFATHLGGFYYTDISPDTTVDGVQANGRLQMTLGGKDNSTVLDMRGSFSRMFWVSAYQEVTVKFDYVLEQSCAYEIDEFSELVASMDTAPLTTGSNPYIARVVGNGDTCPGVLTSGTYTKTFALAPGKHFLEIQGYNNKKNASNEFTTVSIDNVLITASGGQCTQGMSPTYANLCNACDGLMNCQGSCSVNFPSNVGAPCGSCGGVVKCDGTCSEPLNAPCGAPPTALERADACTKDPRVVAGLVSQDVCTGADVFFRETFGGNGRTCASCHPVANNYTIDPTFVQALQASNPNDPLFVARPGTPLQQLETSALLSHALILENVDGFQDPVNRFVSRSVPHLFSLALTLAPDPADGSTLPPLERTGWGGDGAPGDGSLRSFLDGAINQHFTKTLNRVPGTDFRPANDLERDTVESFQLALGRQNELNLATVHFSLASAELGKDNFNDPKLGRCGVCHSNAGANFLTSGRNRNLNNGATGTPTQGIIRNFQGTGQDLFLSDGGFGGANLTIPNIDMTGNGGQGPNLGLDGFGDGNFSVPSLVEAADTGPFFHNNEELPNQGSNPMTRVLAFYANQKFTASTGAQFIDSQPEFGQNNLAQHTQGIDDMLVILNAVFNIDLALQRLQAADKLALDLHGIRGDVQAKLMLLAGEEIEDAVRVLQEQKIHDAERTALQVTLNRVRTADANAPWNTRRGVIATALAELNAVRPQFGSNFNYQLGSGTLMY